MSESRDHEYPYLNAFIGGWLHQDYDIDGDTLEEIVASFKRRSDLDRSAFGGADSAAVLYFATRPIMAEPRSTTDASAAMSAFMSAAPLQK